MRSSWIVSLACVAVVATGCAGTAVVSQPKPGLHQGPLLEGTGGICASGKVVRFQSASTGVVASPPPTVCDGGIPLHGFAVARLKLFPVGHGVAVGSAYVKGVYRDGALYVIAQGEPGPAGVGPVLSDLPCRAPAGGWPTVPVGNAAFEAALRSNRFKGDLTAVRLFRAHGVTVLAVASTHPARTRRILGLQLPARLCVMRSRYGNRVIRKTRARLEASMTHYGIYEVGAAMSGRGQPVLESRTLRMTPRLRAWLRTMPPGLVQIVPDLRRVS